jgi:hypothetical protein
VKIVEKLLPQEVIKKKEKAIIDDSPLNDFLKKCDHCEEYFGVFDVEDHQKKCLEHRRFVEQDEKLATSTSRKYIENDLLNDIQLQAVLYVQGVSEKKSQEAYGPLLTRFKFLKLTENELEKTLKFIRLEAPIIIHFRANLLENFIKDGHYKNTFELYPKNLVRVNWEDRMFNKFYHSAKPIERVKYGVLNVVNDPRGIMSCYSYGDSYLVLDNSKVRLRVTFASCDSGSPSAELATCEHYNHVLLTYSDKEIMDIVSVATKKKFCVESDSFRNYKEIQIHGSVLFDRDVYSLVLNSNYKSDARITNFAEEFCKKFNVNFIWMEK